MLTQKYYPLLDYHPKRKMAVNGVIVGNVMAINSGVRRCPKKGEWYLSGARIAAYKAPNDLSSVELIATLVEITKIRTIVNHKQVEN